MPLPNLSTVCVELEVGSQDLHVTFPGGAELAAQLPTAGIPDPGQLAKQLLAQANAALAPVVPLFNVLDVVLALFECVQAIPDALGPPPDPSKLASCLPDLVEKASKLLQLVPQLSVPLLVVGLIDTLIALLEGVRRRLEAIVAAQARLVDAATRAAELGNAQLQTVIDCASGNLAAELKNQGEGMAPINRLLAAINLLMELAGLPALPPLTDLGTDAGAALLVLDALVAQLEAARGAIPV